MHQRDIDELANSPIQACRSLEERLNAYYRVSSQFFELTRLFTDSETMRQAEFLLQMLQVAVPGPRFPTRERGEACLRTFQSQQPDFNMSWDDLISQGWIRCFYSSWSLPVSQITGVVRSPGHSLLHRFLHLLNEEFTTYKRRIDRYPRISRSLYREKLEKFGVSQTAPLINKSISDADESCVISLREIQNTSLVSWLFAQLWQVNHPNQNFPSDNAKYEWWISLLLAAEVYPSQTPLFLHRPDDILTIGVKQLLQEKDISNAEAERKKAAAALALEYGQKDIIAHYQDSDISIKNTEIEYLVDYCEKKYVWNPETVALMSYFEDIHQKMESGIMIHRLVIAWLLEWEGRPLISHYSRRDIPLLRSILNEGKQRPRLIEYFIERLLHTGTEGCPSLLPYLLALRENLNIVGLALGMLARLQSHRFSILRPRVMNGAEPGETLAIHKEIWSDSVKLALATLLERGEPGVVGTPEDLAAHHRVAAGQLVALYAQLAGEVRPQSNPWSPTKRPRWLEDRLELFLQLLESWPNPFNRNVSVLVPLLPELVSSVQQRLAGVTGQAGTLHRPEITLLLWLLRRSELGPSSGGWTDAVMILAVEYTRLTDAGYRVDFPMDMGWISAVRWLANNQADLFNKILQPRDFAAEIRGLEEERGKQYYGRMENSIRGQLRIHLRFLAFLVENWEQEHRIVCEEMHYEKISIAFSHHLCSYNRDARSDGTLDVFKIIVGLDADESRGMKPLMSSVGRAISSMRKRKQLELVRSYLVLNQDPRRLGQLYGSLTDSESRRLVQKQMAARSAHVDAKHLDYPSAIEIIAIIDALLEAELPEHAEGYIIRYEARMQELWKEQWEMEIFRLRLRCELSRGNLAPLMASSLPAGVPDISETHDTLSFYRAIALMRQTPSNYAAASAIFARLWERDPAEDVYGVNWLAARIGEVTSFPDDREPSIEERNRMLAVVAETEKFIYNEHSIAKSEQFCQNYLYLLRRLQETDRLMRFFHGLPRDWQQKPNFYDHISHASSAAENKYGEESSLSSKQRRSEIRRQINLYCRTDSDLDAFISDYFPPVYQQIASAMTRDQKITLLLQKISMDFIADALKEYHSDKIISEVVLVNTR